MKITACKLLAFALVIVGLVVAGIGMACAQDVYKVNYFSNNNIAGAPEATVRISNPGLTYGFLCAEVYVFDQDQQMAACCGCIQSHNNLATTPIHFLTRSPLTGVVPTNGVIKVVSALDNNSCDPGSLVTPTPNLRVWVTHIQNVGTTYAVTETESSDSTLGLTELSNLQAQCSFIQILGSGQGICSCASD